MRGMVPLAVSSPRSGRAPKPSAGRPGAAVGFWAASTAPIGPPAGYCWGSAVMVAGPLATALAMELPSRVEVIAASLLGRPPPGSSTSTTRSTTPAPISAITRKSSRARGKWNRRARSRARRLRPVSGVDRSLAIGGSAHRRPPASIRPGREGRIGLLAIDQADGVLQLGVLALFDGHIDRGTDGGFLLALDGDVALQPRLADDLVAALEFLGHHLAHLDVRGDAQRLDGAVVGRVVARRGQPHGAVRPQRDDRLHRALAEGAGAHQGGALVVLQC